MNVRRANQLKFLTFVRDRGPLFGVIAVFALSGVVLLSGSYADTPTGSGVASLSLAPADVVVEQGQVINIAMNVDTNGEVAKSIESTIEFAPGALQLQSVQTVCTDPSFQITTKKSTQALGKVTIGCESNMGAVGKHTIATVVFKALSSNSDAPITISNKSNVIRLTDSKSVLGSRTGATIRLESQVKAAVMQPRAVPNYTSKPVCAPKPDRQSCRAQKAYDSNGQELSSPQAVISGYGPKEFHTAYQVPCTPGGPVAAVCATPAAYGPTIAITDAEGYTGGAAGLEKDLAVYNQNYGIAACTIASGCLKVVNQTGGSALPAEVPGSGWAQETILDVIAVHTICQTCKILLVEADDATGNLSFAHRYAATLNPVAISDSWGGGPPPADLTIFDHPGIAQINANGDTGVMDTLNSPSDLPGVVSVSGSTLKVNTDGSWAGETLWSTVPGDPKAGGSGGGCAVDTAAPAWQTALPNWASAGCGTKRGYGDISADGNPSTGAAIYYAGAWDDYGGTSLAAPLVAGMFGLAGAIPSTTVASAMLYANNSSANYHDITSGNDCTATITAHCTTGPGFDIPSGLGAPISLGAFRPVTSTSPPPVLPPPPPVQPPAPTPLPPGPNPLPPPPVRKTGDINGDGKVNITDLSLLLSAWGTNNTAADLNKSGKVDIADLSILLSNFGK